MIMDRTPCESDSQVRVAKIISITQRAINTDLAPIKSWAESFSVPVNPKKSQAFIISNSRMRNKVYVNVPIPLTGNLRNLGLDCDLSWSAYINEIKRLQNFLPLPTKIMLVQTLLLPLIDYANVCYLDTTEEMLLDKLDRL